LSYKWLFLAVSLLALVPVPWLLARYRPPLPVSAHLVFFWLMMPVYGAIGAGVPWNTVDTGAVWFAFMLLFLYVSMFVLAAMKLLPTAMRSERLVDMAECMPMASISVVLWLWVVTKLALLTLYGPHALQLLGDNDVPRLLKDLGYLFNYVAVGAFFLLLLGYGNRHRRKGQLVSIAGALIFFALYVGLNEVGGARRFMLLTALLVFLTALHRRNYRLLDSHVWVVGMVVGLTFIVASEYFQSIRNNEWFFPGQTNVVAPGRLTHLFNPSYDNKETLLSKNLGVRQTGMAHLYATVVFVEQDGLLRGAASWQSLLNTVPRVLWLNKVTVNPDDIFQSHYPFCNANPEWCADLTIGPVAQSYGDFGTMGVIAVAVFGAAITVLLLIAAWEARRTAPLVSCFLVGALMLHIGHVEDVIDSMLVDTRNALVILFVYLAWLGVRRKKPFVTDAKPDQCE